MTYTVEISVVGPEGGVRKAFLELPVVVGSTIRLYSSAAPVAPKFVVKRDSENVVNIRVEELK